MTNLPNDPTSPAHEKHDDGQSPGVSDERDRLDPDADEQLRDDANPLTTDVPDTLAAKTEASDHGHSPL